MITTPRNGQILCEFMSIGLGYQDLQCQILREVRFVFLLLYIT